MSLHDILHELDINTNALKYDTAETINDLVAVAPIWGGLPEEVMAMVSEQVMGMYARDEHNDVMARISEELRHAVYYRSEDTLQRLSEEVAYGLHWTESARREVLAEMMRPTATTEDIQAASAIEDQMWDFYVNAVADHNAYYDAVEHLFVEPENSMYWMKPKREELVPRSYINDIAQDPW